MDEALARALGHESFTRAKSRAEGRTAQVQEVRQVQEHHLSPARAPAGGRTW